MSFTLQAEAWDGKNQKKLELMEGHITMLKRASPDLY
jgi:hypothetical protein